MSARIIDIATKQNWVEKSEPPDTAPDPQQDFPKSSLQDKKNFALNAKYLDVLGRMEQMARDGRIGGFLLVAQDNVTGYFMHELQIPAEGDLHELFGFIGILENIKLELAERTAMAPMVNLDGKIVDPYEELSS